MEGISFVHFDERDVVRHSLVQRIVRAYEKYNESGPGNQLSLRLSGAIPVEVPPPAAAIGNAPAGTAIQA